MDLTQLIANNGTGIAETFERKLVRNSDSMLVAHRLDTSVAMPESDPPTQTPTMFNSAILGGDAVASSRHQSKPSDRKLPTSFLRSEDIDEVLTLSSKLLSPKRVGDMSMGSAIQIN